MKNTLIALVGRAARSTPTRRGLFLLLVVLGLLASAVGSPCQVNRRAQQIPRTLPPPCCAITAIDTNAGVVTAKVNANGNIFQFQVTNAALLNSLKVGQGVYANFTTKQVSLDGTTVCCNILAPPAPHPPTPPTPASPAGGAPPSASTSSAATSSAATSSAATSSATKSSAAPGAVSAIGSKLAPPPPCCTITAIDTNAGLVFAKVNANDDIFEFKVTDATLLNSLKVGQGVYANFTTMQVSLDGITACCSITKPPAPQPKKPNTSTGSGGAKTQLRPKTLAEPKTATIPLAKASDVPMETLDLDPNRAGALQTSNLYVAPVPNCVASLSVVKLPLSVPGHFHSFPVVKFELSEPDPTRPQSYQGCSASANFYPGVQLRDGWSVVSLRAGDDHLNPLTPDVFTLISEPSGRSLWAQAKLAIPQSGERGTDVSLYLYMEISGPKGTDPYPPIASGSASPGSASPGSTAPTGAPLVLNPVCAGPSTLEGVDVSHYAGTIDWKKVRASGRTFAYANATDGVSYLDPSFAQNYAAIKAAGLVRGASHFFHPDQDPVAQADRFLSTIGTLQPGDLPPALDVEITDGQDANTIVAGINTWMARVKAQTGLTPILYSAAGFLSPLGSTASTLSNYPLWAVNWNVSCPTIPSTWQKWVLWQYAGSGTVPGISGAVALNRFNGTLADLKALAKLSTSRKQASSATGQTLAGIQPLTPLSPATTAPQPTANQPTTNQASTSSAASAATAASGQTQSKIASTALAAAPPPQGVSLPSVGAPAAQTAGSAKTLAAAGPSSVVQNVGQRLGALPQLSYGTPQPAPSGPRGMPARWESRGNYMHLRGLDGIEQAQGIPEGVRTLLKIHVMALEPGQSDHYLINPQLAQEWSNTHPVRAEIKPPNTGGDGHTGCNAVSWHCAGEAAKHAEDETSRQADMLRKQAQDDWKNAGELLTADWHEVVGCFDEDSLSLANIPIEFAASPSVGIHLQESGKTTNGSPSGNAIHGSASGMAEGTVNLALPIKSPDFQANLDVFYVRCLPFMIRPKSMSGQGTLTVGSKLTAAVKATGQFEETIPTGFTQIPIQVIPIVLFGVPIAEMDVSVYVEGNIEVGGQGTFTANFELDNPHEMKINFSCDGHGCSGDAPPVAVPTTAAESAQLNGRIHVKPMIFTAIQLDFDIDALTARAGPQPYLYGELYGCVAGAASQNVSSGSSTAQDWYALTADLDWGIDFRAEALITGKRVGSPLIRRLVSQDPPKHIGFWDLAHSTALLPQVQGLTQGSLGTPALYTIKMPTCYPYPDKVKYQLAWTGGAIASNVAPGTTVAGGVSSATLATRGMVQPVARLNVGRNGAPSPSTNAQDPCNLQSGQGYCEFDPVKDLSLDLAWPAAGNYNLTVTAVGDTPHGRVYNSAQPTTLNVTVGSSDSSSAASASNGGTPPAPPPPAGSSANSPAPPSISTPTTAAMGQPLNAQKTGTVRQPVQTTPCCVVTAMDSRTNIFTAKTNAEGRMFEFQITNPNLLGQIHPGTSMYANFKTRQVSLDGTTPCGTIVGIEPAPSAPRR